MLPICVFQRGVSTGLRHWLVVPACITKINSKRGQGSTGVFVLDEVDVHQLTILREDGQHVPLRQIERQSPSEYVSAVLVPAWRGNQPSAVAVPPSHFPSLLAHGCMPGCRR